MNAEIDIREKMDREQTAHEAIECQQGDEVRKDVLRPKAVEISARAIIRV